jgi:hypothetical protein
MSPPVPQREVHQSTGLGVAARILRELGAGLLELREAVAARYAAGGRP